MYRTRKGQSLVEFALVLPILVVLLVGIVEFGFMFNTYLQINHAARHGARLAAVGTEPTEIRTAMQSTTQINIDTANEIDINPESVNDRISGQTVTVTVTRDYHTITGLMDNIISNNIQLQAHTTMRVE